MSVGDDDEEEDKEEKKRNAPDTGISLPISSASQGFA